jgi:stress response protein YsnF
MERYGAIDVDERATHWRQSGWTRFDPDAEPYHTPERPAAAERHTTQYTAANVTPERGLSATEREREPHRKGDEGDVRVPVVEEQVEVGKRQVHRGGVRLYTRVIERPVEETIRLRDERVTVDRHAADRPATEADMATLKEGSIEVTETDEEPVVSKRTRVVEEVVVSKEVEERTETVRDAARRTEVEVEPLEVQQTTTDYRGFEAYDADFRSHYETSLASRGHAYDRWDPAYRYGYDLAQDRRYAGSDWTVIEPEARRHWDERHQGTWEEFKDTIRYAWDKVRGRR